MLKTLAYPKVENLIRPYPELGANDICQGADPFIFKSQDQWHILLQNDSEAQNGISGYVLISAPTIPGLTHGTMSSLKVSHQNIGLKQVWAGEIHFEKYLYVAASDGDNRNHRMYVYETEGDIYGPWKEIGLLEVPEPDDCWSIDLTFFTVPYDGNNKTYAVWSGWQCRCDEFPQHLYVAEMLSPTSIGPRHLIATPNQDWCSSVASILEGPQSLVLNGKFRGLVVTGNASWTEKYSTRILKYDGSGNPLDANSWKMAPESLFKDGYGIGHGMIVEEDGDLYYVGHRKTSLKHGWEDRVVFYTRIKLEDIEKYLNS